MPDTPDFCPAPAGVEIAACGFADTHSTCDMPHFRVNRCTPVVGRGHVLPESTLQSKRQLLQVNPMFVGESLFAVIRIRPIPIGAQNTGGSPSYELSSGHNLYPRRCRAAKLRNPKENSR